MRGTMNLMPSILHSAWLQSLEPKSQGELFLWARHLDVSAQPQPSEKANGGRTAPERPRIPSHPQQMALGQLRQRLAHQFPYIAPDKMRPVNTAAWFPTLNGVPETRRGIITSDLVAGDLAKNDEPRNDAAASPANLGAADAGANGVEVEQPEEQPILAPWQISGVAISAVDALHFLNQLSSVDLEASPTTSEDPQSSANGSATTLLINRLRISNDLLFLSSVAKFALEVLASQHYLPSIQVDGFSNFHAIWQPALLDAATNERFVRLVEEMPSVCRSYNLDSPAQAVSATALTETMVAALVDSAIRTWSTPFTIHQNRNGVTATPSNFNGSRADKTESSAVNGTVQRDIASFEQPEFHWLTRLLAPENRLTLPPQPSHLLYREWQAWIDQLHIATDAGFRFCFKLTDPDALLAEREAIAENEQVDSEQVDSELWQLSYHLQSRNNPSVFISATEIWATSTPSVIVEELRIDQPQERFLAGLGAVSHLFDPIKHSLTEPRPEYAKLTVHEAYQFMREIGPLLQSSGFGVIVPDWWSAREERQLGLRLRLLSDEKLTDELLFGVGTEIDYSWDLTLGDERIDQDGLADLIALEAPLVRIQGRWTELNPEQISTAQRFLQAETAPQKKDEDGFAQTTSATRAGNLGKMTLLQALRMISQSGSDMLSDGYGIEPDGADPKRSTTKAKPKADESNAVVAQEIAPDISLQLDGLIQPPALLPVVGVDVNGWIEKAIQKLWRNESMPEIAEPTGFEGELRPYQRRGVAWLSYLRQLGIGACLADDMGLGKTIQAIALHLHIKANVAKRAGGSNGSKTKPQVYPTLLICPTSVLANWQREIERFAPALRALIHHGNNRLLGEPFLQIAAKQDFVITSYGTARRDIDFLQRPIWQDVILDEAQNIKNPNAKQTQAVLKLRAQHRIALTGTPIENRLSELWSIFEFLNPGYLGGQTRFHKEYILPIERYNSERHINRLRRTVQPFLLRRLKTDPAIISDLPEKNEMVVYCSLTHEQQQLYMKVVDSTLRNLDESAGMQRRGLILGLITKLKQIANHPAHFLKEKPNATALTALNDRSGKLSRLTEMLEEALSVGDNALIFTQFVEMGSLLQKYLSDIIGEDIPFLHGGCSAMQRDRMVQAFQSDDGPPVFILSLRAGGSGLNLTRANHVFHFDRWWNPAIENQATDRAFRIGQQRNVQVHKFVSAGTLEEHIHELLESKRALAENIVGSGEEWLTEMDNKQLRELLMLRHQAAP